MIHKIIYIPENLDLEKITRVTPPNFEFDYEYAHILLYDVIKDSNQKLFNIKDWPNFYEYKSSKKYMIRRSSVILQRNRRDYANYLNYLFKTNILWRESYSEKVCRSYQLAPQYFGSKLKLIKIQNPKNTNLLNLKSEDQVLHMPLIKWFNNQLSVDIESASEDLNMAFSDATSYYHYVKKFQSIVDVSNGIFNFSRKVYSDDRLHSQFTRFPKTLRKYLRYDNEVLGEVDISSSIPFFMYYHFLAIVDKSKINLEVYNAFFKKPRIYQKAFEITKQMVQLDPDEVNNFGSVVLKGNYYRQFLPFFNDEYFLEVAKNELNRDFNYSEDDKLIILKKRMLSWQNAKEKFYTQEQIVFKQLYPTIYNFILIFKKRRYLPKKGPARNKIERMIENDKDKITSKFKQHKKIAHFLLQSESHFMLNYIAAKLNKRKSRLPFFTLHDCIITKKENLDEIKDFMEKAFTEVIGFSPNFKAKIFE